MNIFDRIDMPILALGLGTVLTGVALIVMSPRNWLFGSAIVALGLGAVAVWWKWARS